MYKTYAIINSRTLGSLKLDFQKMAASARAALDRTILVSGANRGIGLEVCRDALNYMSSKSLLFLGCRDLNAGKVACAKELEADARVIPVQLDISDEASIASCLETVSQHLGESRRLDVLVNNAGILLQKDENNEEYDHRLGEKTLSINFEGTVRLTSTFLPLLKRSREGVEGSMRAAVLATSSGVGVRTLGMLREDHRLKLMDMDTLNLEVLRQTVREIMSELAEDQKSAYHDIPTVAYGISKMALNCYTRILARDNAKM